jgi:hypothetical protein
MNTEKLPELESLCDVPTVRHTPTPGTWKVSPPIDFPNNSSPQFDVYSHGENGWDYGPRFVCSCRCYSDNNEANAQLISAAPELLQALEDMLEYGTNAPKCCQEQARAAILKAKGAK